jgi:hypothetical protein
MPPDYVGAGETLQPFHASLAASDRSIDTEINI